MEKFFVDMDELIKCIEGDSKTYEELTNSLGCKDTTAIKNWKSYKHAISGNKKSAAEKYYEIKIDRIKIEELIIKLNATSNVQITSNKKKVMNLLLLDSSLGIPGKTVSIEEILKIGEKYKFNKSKIKEALNSLEEDEFVIKTVKGWRLNFTKCKQFIEGR